MARADGFFAKTPLVAAVASLGALIFFGLAVADDDDFGRLMSGVAACMFSVSVGICIERLRAARKR